MHTILLLLCGLWQSTFAYHLVDQYMQERTLLLNRENEVMVGSDVILNNEENLVNNIIMTLKKEILDDGFKNTQYFNFSKHFFTYKDEVKDSDLYKILKLMPKGALLHAHDTGMLDSDFLLNITYWNNLYICLVKDKVNYIFSKDIPRSFCKKEWQLLKDIRSSCKDIKAFDTDLRKHFTMVIDNPGEVYTDINKAWLKFSDYFKVTSPLLTYKPVWDYYFYETLRKARKDNVMYLEIRSVLPELYDLEENIYNSVATAQSYWKVLNTFKQHYPDFIGAKLIYAPVRRINPNTIEEYIKIAKQIKELLPDFLAGFDLVGQEDLGRPTRDFLPQLLEVSGEVDFIFHAGETNWYGTTSDENIVDAIMLGSRRLGHAYALSKHPLLMNEVKRKEIAVEVNVISNAVLGLVQDIRNHPLATFLAYGLPVVISSDDPGIWEADVLTHDFFVTFLGVASRQADLRLLKKLALNSLQYSTLSNKDDVVRQFEAKWRHFIRQILRDYYMSF